MTGILSPMGQVRAAGNAAALLEAFSSSFASMKPTINVVTERVAGRLDFIVRDMHGAYELNAIVTKNSTAQFTRDGSSQSAHLAWNDSNIEIHRIDEAAITRGNWSLTTNNEAGFVVARTRTYPKIVFPVSASGEQSVRHVPMGKPAVVVAKAEGALGAAEEILLNGGKLEKPSQDLNWAELPVLSEDTIVTAQIGTDSNPLRIKRDFLFRPLSGLPQAQAAEPTGCVADTPCPLKVSFAPGATNIKGNVYVLDDTSKKLIFAAPMSCDDQKRECIEEGFKPQDGQGYQIRYLLEARSPTGILYSDYADTPFSMTPAIYIKNLPSVIYLKDQPAGGWPVDVVVGTREDLGRLSAKLTISQNGGQPIDVPVQFGFDALPGRQESTTLRALLPGEDQIPTGPYEGELTFQVEKGEARIVPAKVRVLYELIRPRARLSITELPFGEVVFEPAEDFTVYLTKTVAVNFEQRTFPLTAEVISSSCSNFSIGLAEQPVESEGGPHPVTFYLRSNSKVVPDNCTGKVRLAGVPADRFDIRPAELIWSVKIAPVSWQIVGSLYGGQRTTDLRFDRLTFAGEQASGVLLIYYSGKPAQHSPSGGKPPFTLRNLTLHAESASSAAITDADIDLQVGPVPSTAQDDGYYHVPVSVKARRDIQHDWWNGALYAGDLTFEVDELPGASEQHVHFNVHSPSWVQRNVIPPVNTVYGFWLPLWLPGSLTLPLTAFLLLLIRRRTIDGVEDEEELVQERNVDGSGTQVEPEPPNWNLTDGPAETAQGLWEMPQWGGEWRQSDWEGGGGLVNSFPDSAPNTDSWSNLGGHGGWGGTSWGSDTPAIASSGANSSWSSSDPWGGAGSWDSASDPGGASSGSSNSPSWGASGDEPIAKDRSDGWPSWGS
ncbi:MAG TPA: hypothetical protein VF914_08375 [Chloroflexia bacterium]